MYHRPAAIKNNVIVSVRSLENMAAARHLEYARKSNWPSSYQRALKSAREMAKCGRRI